MFVANRFKPSLGLFQPGKNAIGQGRTARHNPIEFRRGLIEQGSFAALVGDLPASLGHDQTARRHVPFPCASE